MHYAIILAGGVGSRFWPLSRAFEPKQFLNLCSDKPMIEETIHRIEGLIRKENIYIATNQAYSEKIEGCITKLGVPRKNILFEPSTKNTFAPISALSALIYSKDTNAVISVLPCDHYIKFRHKFVRLLRKAASAAEKGPIITLGITPKRPETGYGYIKVSSKLGRRTTDFYKVERFVEKPDNRKARAYIKDKRYYWNSGIFVFRADTLLEEIRKFIPRIHPHLLKVDDMAALVRSWGILPAISIDYAIMEKTKRIALLPSEYGWLDLGSWQAVEETLKKDKNGNISRGDCVLLDTRNTLTWSDDHLVATIGLKDVIIVNARNALLVCAKDRAQDVKKVVELLKKHNFHQHL
ncbi:MAG: NTP transferase domain-containing protein [Candidatus Omnitrophica bacterium]|nr:NTP transferase domain-containing protein [Candidatus Omnitrophota bacterium]